MPPLRYRPYDDVETVPNVVVDGSPNAATVLVLSHWPGLPTPAGLAADLSAQMAFRYLDIGPGCVPERNAGCAPERNGRLHGQAEVVTNNHFDQDGLVSVYALACPDDAQRHRELLIDLAAAGDFATYRFREAARLSMVVAAFTDADRSPLGREGLTGAYPEQCAALYTEALARLPELIADVTSEGTRWRHLWVDEDAELTSAEEALAAGEMTIDEEPELDLAVVLLDDTPRRGGHRFGGRWASGLHPMALHNATSCFRVAQLSGRRYELGYRYETWVQYRSRTPLPRVDLSALAEELTAAEPAGSRWAFDGVADLVPRLALTDPEAESGLEPEDFLARVRRHLASGPPAWDPYATG